MCPQVKIYIFLGNGVETCTSENRTATVLQTSLSGFPQVWRLLVLKASGAMNMNLFLNLFFYNSKKNKTCVCVWFIERSGRDGELHDFIVGANRDHRHRNVVVVYLGFAQLRTVPYVIFYCVCSIESLCISSLCRCHCLNLLDIKFCSFLSQQRTLCFVDEPLWWRSTLLLLLSLERTNKTFYDLQIWWKLPVCETERGKGKAVWALVDKER